jgi:hypothetical protein
MVAAKCIDKDAGTDQAGDLAIEEQSDRCIFPFAIVDVTSDDQE